MTAAAHPIEFTQVERQQHAQAVLNDAVAVALRSFIDRVQFSNETLRFEAPSDAPWLHGRRCLLRWLEAQRLLPSAEQPEWSNSPAICRRRLLNTALAELVAVRPASLPIESPDVAEGHRLVRAALAREPGLTANGFEKRRRGRNAREAHDRRELGTDAFARRVGVCVQWIALVGTRETISRTRTSYGWKHYVERWVARTELRNQDVHYIPQGALIAAALGLGLPYAQCGSSVETAINARRADRLDSGRFEIYSLGLPRRSP